jgi:protein-L-isoaspartate(D-aspartate) O-methyltransferase
VNIAAETVWFDALRRRMVEFQLRDRGITDQRVLDAMARVPRHEFAPQRYRNQSYEDHPLPIGEGQTISQPYIVALMLEGLALMPTDRVLEVGTGSGYVTALLAEITQEVISIERHATLADDARNLLQGLGYNNVKIITGDGSQGYAPSAPYNAIVVSAAAPELPRTLLEQLAEGSRMIIPVGQGDSQQLQLILMQNGQPQITLREFCRFVPLVSDDITP